MSNEDRPTLLVVDDDQAIRDVVRDFLTDEGYRVLAVETRDEARDVLARETVSLVLLDTTDRAPVCHECAPFAGDHPPVVLFSAVSDPAPHAHAIGAVAWLSKPFGLEELLSTVQQNAST